MGDAEGEIFENALPLHLGTVSPPYQYHTPMLGKDGGMVLIRIPVR